MVQQNIYWSTIQKIAFTIINKIFSIKYCCEKPSSELIIWSCSRIKRRATLEMMQKSWIIMNTGISSTFVSSQSTVPVVFPVPFSWVRYCDQSRLVIWHDHRFSEQISCRDILYQSWASVPCPPSCDRCESAVFPDRCRQLFNQSCKY